MRSAERKGRDRADEAVHKKGPVRVRIQEFWGSVHKNGLSGVRSGLVGGAKRRCALQSAKVGSGADEARAR